jgi:hypothetical protein
MAATCGDHFLRAAGSRSGSRRRRSSGGGELLDQAADAGLSPDDLEDLEDAPDAEVEQVEQEVMDRATTARTIEELRLEIGLLRDLEKEADALVRSGQNRSGRSSRPSYITS